MGAGRQHRRKKSCHLTDQCARAYSQLTKTSQEMEVRVAFLWARGAMDRL